MILYRYIIREHILPFLYSLAVIIFILTMAQVVQLLDKVISKGLDPRVVIELFLIQLGWIIALAVPMAILVATLMAFGQMSADNEITAIKASGRNLYNLLTPVLASSLVIAVMLVYFNNLILPNANHRLANLQSDISRKRPAAFIEPGVLIRDFSDYALYVTRVNARSGYMRDVKIFSDVRGEDPTVTVADSGHICLTADGQHLQLTLFHGESHSIRNATEYTLARFERQVIIIKNVDSQFKRTESSYRGDREKSSAMMLLDIAQARKRRADGWRDYNAAVDSIAAMVSTVACSSGIDAAAAAGRPSGTLARWRESAVAAVRSSLPGLWRKTAAPPQPFTPDSSFINWARTRSAGKTEALAWLRRAEQNVARLSRQIRNEDLEINQYLVEVHKKYAIPVTCIVFVLIGAPLGIMARRGGMAVGASYSIFFFILFWACYIGGEAMADKLLIPAWLAMWSGNILVGIGGLILLVRMIREQGAISLGPVMRLWARLAAGRHQEGRRPGALALALRVAGALVASPLMILKPLTGTLPLYLIRKFLGYLVGLTIGLVIIFSVVDYISMLKRFEGAELRQIAVYYFYYTPWFINSFLPIVVLLATMFAVGSMAKHSELTAMKGAGIGLRQLAVPLLLVGIALSAFGFYFGEKVLPPSNAKRKDLEVRFEEKRNPSRGPARGAAGSEFKRNFYYFGPQHTVYFFQEFWSRPSRTKGVWRSTFDGPAITSRVEAQSLDRRGDAWYFVKGQTRTFDGDSAAVVTFDTLRDTVLHAAPEEMVARIKVKEEMSYWELDETIGNLKAQGEKTAMYTADLYFKLALPLMNFIVILLGVSITARAGRKGGAVLFGVGLAIVFAYYILSRFALAFAESGQISPFTGAWIGNILFFALGLALYRRASQ